MPERKTCFLWSTWHSKVGVVARAATKRAWPICIAVTQASQVSTLSALGSPEQRPLRASIAVLRAMPNHSGSS
ncbi:hypothetical protein AQI70_35115 [Streptomyces curacoi]|uniref:Uncharacterized protein n=1 Tax=Streptomyces curacoi TaxID=146536 RepID=A0A124GUD8_9ACTN|nr:hypothetical protein AQI70_35115 [Streptomyces curacoi]